MMLSYIILYGDLENGFEQALSLLLFYIHQTSHMAKCSSGPICTQSVWLPSCSSRGKLAFLSVLTPRHLMKAHVYTIFHKFPIPTFSPHIWLLRYMWIVKSPQTLWIVATDMDKHQELIRPWRKQHPSFVSVSLSD